MIKSVTSLAIVVTDDITIARSSSGAVVVDDNTYAQCLYLGMIAKILDDRRIR